MIYNAAGYYLSAYDSFHQNEDVKNILTRIADASESYARTHGEYPNSYSELYFADPPYIDDLLCGVERVGYRFSCKFFRDGYELQAIPTKKGQVPYQLLTGGTLR